MLQISVVANRKLYDEIREEDNMNEVLRDFFKNELEEAEQKGREEGEKRERS